MITGLLLINAWLLGKIMLILLFTVTVFIIALLSFLFERKVFLSSKDDGHYQTPSYSGPEDNPSPGKFFDSIRYYSSEWLLFLPLLMMVCFIPWGSSIKLFGQNIQLQIAQLESGILYSIGFIFLCIPAILKRRVNNDYNERIFRNIQSSISFICFGLSFVMTVISIIMVSGTTRLEEIVNFQKDAHWYIFYQPLGFIILLVSSFALISVPFMEDIRGDAGQGAASDSVTRVPQLHRNSIGNHLLIFIICLLIATLYFGGYDLPGIDDISLRNSIGPNKTALIELVSLLVKALIFVAVFLSARRFAGRISKIRWMNFGWKILFPVSVFNVIITGIIILTQ